MRADAADALGAAFAGLATVPSELNGIRALITSLIAKVDRLQAQLPSALGTKRDAAKILGVSLSTVDRMIAAGQLPATRAGRSVRIDLAAIRPATENQIAEMARAAVRGT